MKNCYYLVLALMFISVLVAPVIVSPVMAQEMKTIEVIVGDENYQFLNDVIIFVYEIVGGVPGPVHSVWTIDSGDTITLPRREYFLVPAKPDYLPSNLPSSPGGVDVPEEETYASLIMVSAPGIGYPAKIRAIDENEVLIPDVTFKIYRCTSSPPYSPIELVRNETSSSGELYLLELPKDYYCVEVEKEGYSQRYATGENRFANHDDFPTLNIDMDSHIEPTIEPFRKGSVTMTDHNGTPISGFEVKAVNYYTGEEYTVSTQTDVAVITLPMDRTTEIRNPWTGVYEEAPAGYYTFYGQKPGYKMLNEEGIKVSVLPEKYDSYKLCDILVRSESGPLTGKHKFQIRSRADFSILQTGTISAKSRTTGIWYNTTVVDGLATLILPYDTSDAISEYAGQYYVYATSPGYEDSDYGTQISIYPREIYEITTILLTPIGGVPPPGNVTLRIQTISETGQSVPNAEIFISGVYGEGKDVWDTYTTSWTGFLEVSVPDNSIYDIVARADGYYDSSQRIDLSIQDPTIIEMRLYRSGAPIVEPTVEPTDWPTGPPTTQPTGGIPDEDDDSDGFMVQAVRSIANLFGVSFGIGKTILGMLIALAIGMGTAKQLKGGAQEFGMGMLGGVVLGVLIGLLPIWVLVLLVLIIGLWIGQRYMSGGDS